MDGKTHEERLLQIERWLATCSKALDDDLTAQGIDPDAFRRLAKDPPPFTPELQRIYDELTETNETAPAPVSAAPRFGTRI